MLKIALMGAQGRMAQAILKTSLVEPGVEIVGVISRAPENVVENLNISIKVVKDLKALAKEPINAVIDFTNPTLTMGTLAECVEKKYAMVIGTTGLDLAQKQIITEAAKQIPICLAPNTSVGVNLLFKLAGILAAALDTADIEIIEAHHKHKLDAPSGTSLHLGEVIAKARGIDLKEHAVYSRVGKLLPRQAESIGFSCVRAGEIIGEHTALFCFGSEQIEIKHTALNRNIYAEGALKAAKWLMSQSPGLYGMDDVLDLKTVV